MTSKGRHSSESPGGFYRDLAMMIAGIILVGAAVFLLLFLLADDPSSPSTTVLDTTTTSATTTSTAQTTSSTSSTLSTTTSTTIPVRPAGEIRVVVLNSIGLTGAAGRLTNELDDLGYLTLEADDFEPEQDPSRIWYRDGFAAEANELLVLIPDALVEALPDAGLVEGADIIIIIGTGYQE